ncbi:MAG: hypothetical protein KKH91_01015, partial [Elusimicrobia bacterium]|nr:hypothetical protein [Elusimicrobiota bacterium]
ICKHYGSAVYIPYSNYTKILECYPSLELTLGEFQRTGLNKAVNYYEKSISMDKAHSERSAFDLGEIYRKTGRIDDAIRAYNISVGARNYGEVYNCLGNCYWMKNDFLQAQKYWELAVKLGLPKPEDQKIAENNLQILQKKIK